MTDHRLLVLADAHFASPSPQGLADEAAFLHFLATVPRPGDALLLAGDLYDFWFSYPQVIPARNFQVTAALATLARRLPVLMIGGNHDRWGAPFWNTQPGVTFAPHTLPFTLGEHAGLAIHGDGLHETRRRDRVLNALIRSPAAIGLFRLIPPALGQPIGQALGHDGRQRHTPPAEVAAAADRQEQWARAYLAANPALALLVMGHTHHPACVMVAPGRWYLNPGPWYREHRFAIIDQHGPRLETFRSPP